MDYEFQPYSLHLGIELVQVTPDIASGVLPARSELTDVYGHMTGGAYTSLADAVAGAAARATGDDYVTQNCSLQFYVSTVPDDVELRASARVRHRGSKTCIIAVELSHVDGTVVCDGQFSYCKV